MWVLMFEKIEEMSYREDKQSRHNDVMASSGQLCSEDGV